MAWSEAAVMVARLAAGESVLVHGGSSGIGTMAIQVARALGASPVACTVGSDAKASAVRDLGADTVVNYREQDFVSAVKAATAGRGADVILDIIGAKYLAPNVSVLAPDGRLVVIGLQGGMTAEIDLGVLMRSRGAVHVTSLRGRPLEQKAEICRAVVVGLWPLVADGRVRPVVGASYPMDRVADAHQLVESSGHIGKVLLVRP
jgi:NADPH:quinone reductase-like Zn-dependent oxidoreductase